MTSKKAEMKWIEEFKEFTELQGIAAPNELSQSILSRTYRKLNPSPWLVFAKLIGIHLIIGTLSLAICNQFDMSPFRSSFSLSNYFMELGHSTCMTLCGFLFVGLSITFSLLVLSKEEFLVLKKNSYIQIPSLGILSLVGFLAFGADVVMSFGMLWLIGAMVGGLAPIYIYRFRLS